MTTCIPSWGAFQMFAPHLQPVTGDWYVTSDIGRDSWAVARRMRWLRQNHPDKVFFFIPLATAYGGATSPRSRALGNPAATAVDLRAQTWMAVAGGCKGVLAYHGRVAGLGGGRGPLLNPLLQPNNELWGELGALCPRAHHHRAAPPDLSGGV